MQKKLVLAIFLILICVIGILVYLDAKPDTLATEQSVTETPTPTIVTSSVSIEEQQAIELWIKENNLNYFGDHQDTAYAGGTPLFNEMTGQRIERFTYIVEKHPEKPWNQ